MNNLPVESNIIGGRRRTARMSIPDEFLCPITHEVMMDPVLSRIGFTFERQAVMEWLANHGSGTCPMTRRPIRIFDLVSHHTLRTRIRHGLGAQGQTLEDDSGLESEDFEVSFLLDDNLSFDEDAANLEDHAATSERRRMAAPTTPANRTPQVIPWDVSLFSLAMRQGKCVPRGFVCPWRQDVMREPILLVAAGVSMERASLVECLVMSLSQRASETTSSTSSLRDRFTATPAVFTCPLTKKSLEPGDLVYHQELRDRIQIWCQEQGYVLTLSDQEEGDLGHEQGPDLLWEDLVREAEAALANLGQSGKPPPQFIPQHKGRKIL